MHLNHLGLDVTDVLATAEMFEKYFGLCRAPGPFNAKMAFLTDDNGSFITLFHNNEAAYPKLFHLGFMQATVEQVNAMHARLTEDGFEPQEPREEHGRFTFYFNAPGGFVVEVNALLDKAPLGWKNAIRLNEG